MAERLDLAGRTALITGAAGGIGLGTARALHRRGANVVITDLDRSACERAADSISSERTLGLAADVTDEDAVAAAVARTVDQYGSLDVVVANAGIAQQVTTLRNIDPAEFDRVLDINIHGVVHTVRQSLPHVIEARGHALLIASVYAFTNGVVQSSYAMSKAAVEQLGRALRVELASHGASAGVGYFGFVDTAMVAGSMSSPGAEQMKSAYPKFLHKQITPDEAGEALAKGIERRAAQTIRPRRWTLMSALRGVVGPLTDEQARGYDQVQAAIRTTEVPEPRDGS